MKKRITLLITLCSIFLAAALSFAVYSYIGYADTSRILDDIEDEKEDCMIDNSEEFINPNPKTSPASIKEKSIDGYKYLYMLNDIAFISYSEQWDEEKLEELSSEFLKNKHGEEMDYVSKVVLSPEKSDEYAGFHNTAKESYQIPFSFYNIFPDDTTFEMNSKLSIITLVDADMRNTIDDMARILSHEYGHHFIEYYFNITYTDKDQYTQYYGLRGDGYDDIRFSHGDSYEEYLDNHMWYLFEVGAEDYVYLMGSDTGKQIVEFYDDYDKLVAYSNGTKNYNKIKYSYKPSLNSTPHENTVLPMPSQVEGLAEYYYSFIDEEPPQYITIAPVGDLNLQTTRTGNHSHKITWDKPYTDSDVLYTVFICDENERLMFTSKTVWGDGKARARLGTHDLQKNGWVYSMTTSLEDGMHLNIRVSITFPDGTVVMSDAVELIF